MGSTTLCFATLNESLTHEEKTGIIRLARKGRRSLRTGQQTNPVLVLTKSELLGDSDPEEIAKRLPEKFRTHLDTLFFRGDVQEICDFSLQVHLGMEPVHDWWKAKTEEKRRRKGSPTTVPKA